jgi:Ca2+-binding EF-hand superfamily protein
MFTKADTNKDATVTQAEFEAAKQQRVSEHISKKFERHDTNSDGSVTRGETPGLPDKFFEQLDLNSDGAVTQDEAKAGMQRRMDKQKHHRGGNVFAKLDTDHDGKLTRQETQGAGDSRFAKLDANGDGFLTRQELKTHRRGKGARKHGKSHQRGTHAE